MLMQAKIAKYYLFFEIISILPLFNKYVAITFLKLEFDIKLEFTKIEFLRGLLVTLF